MKGLLRILCYIVILVLSGCFKPVIVGDPQTIGVCKTVCKYQLHPCCSRWIHQCPRCLTELNQKLRKNFCNTVHEERIRSGIIKRCLNSYQYPLQCRIIRCNGTDDYTRCIQSCTDMIQKPLISVQDCT